MIGSTVRLGFDATAVQKGLGGLGGLFGRIGRQIGVGGLQRIGHGVTDLMGRIAMAVPQASKELLEWSGTLHDVSAQTGATVKDLIELGEAMDIAGVSVGDGSRMLSVLNDNLNEASKGAEAQKKALNELGFGASDFTHMNIVESFEAIGKRVAQLGPEFRGLEGIMADLFGARMGMQLIRLFGDYDNFMKMARKNTQGLTQDNAGMIGSFDKMDEAMGRWTAVRRNLTAGLLEGLSGGEGADFINSTMDKLNGFADVLRGVGAEVRGVIDKTFTDISKNGLSATIGNMLKTMGQSFGDGMAEGFKRTFAANPFGGVMKSLFSSNTSSDPLLKENQKQTGYLAKIQRDGVTARYA